MSDNLVENELSKLLNVLSHPHRILIVEELGSGEKDVNNLMELLGVSQSRVSQHLAVMRAQNIVQERREGRHVFYHLSQPEISEWLLCGLDFIKNGIQIRENLIVAVKEVQDNWSHKIHVHN